MLSCELYAACLGLCVLLCATECAGDMCPPKCVCEQRIAVHCASKGLTKIPKKLPSGTVQLLAENNAIEQLPVHMLRNGEALHTLVLHANEIGALSERNFRSTPSLNYLDLSHNNISYIPANSFYGLQDLHMLSLSMNDISRVSPSAFTGLPSLRDLFLSENNIRALPLDLFANLGSLHNLHLDGNSISTVPDGLFRTLTSLVSLDLSRNRIRRIAIGTTRGLRSLQNLFLHSNQIGVIDEHLSPTDSGCEEGVGKTSKSEVVRQSHGDGAFANVRLLQTLDLRFNSLRTIKFSSFAQLTHLRDLKLEENRWRCDCSLKTTINELRIHLRNQDLSWGEIHCSEPQTIKNINLDDLSLRDIKSVVPKTTTTTSTTTTFNNNVYVWKSRNTIEKNADSRPIWHRGDDDGHAAKNDPELPQKPKIGPVWEDDGGKGISSEIRPTIVSLSTPALGGNRDGVDRRTLHDPGFAKDDRVLRKEINPTVPPDWSLNRVVGGGAISTIASYSPRYHSNGGDDVSTRLFGHFPTVPNKPVKSRQHTTMVTMETRSAEDRSKNRQPGNGTSDSKTRDGHFGINAGKDNFGREADVDLDQGVLKKEKGESPSKKEKGTETWMLACVVVLSIFAVIACTSLTIQKHYQRNNKEWRCCFKKENFHASASIRSVTTYPLLYDNALARRPLPREPTFVPNSRENRREDVRWTNGGVYGLGSNRSSFISIQASQTNLNNLGGISGRSPTSQVDLHGSRAPLLPPTPSRMTHDPVAQWNPRLSLGLPGKRDSVPLPTRRGWSRDVENFTLVPTRERQRLQRSQSTAVTTSERPTRPEPVRSRSDRSERQRRASDERQRHRRRRRTGRRPESAIIVPTLLEQEDEFPLRPEHVARQDVSRRSVASRDVTAQRQLRRHKSECRPPERQTTGLHQIREITEEVRSAAEKEPFNQALSRNCANGDAELKPAYDVLERLDGLLAQHLSRITSPETSVVSDSGHGTGPDDVTRGSKSTCNMDKGAPDLTKNLRVRETTERMPQSCPKAASPPVNHPQHPNQIANKTPGNGRINISKAVPSVSYKNGGYDVLLLCTSGAKSSEITPKITHHDASHTPSIQPSPTERTKVTSSKVCEKKEDPYRRRGSTDSMFVDLESLCESLITEDSGSCFGDGEADFEFIYPTIDCYRTCPGDVYGSDQYILDSLRRQDKMVMRPMNHTSPGALEHLTVPLSELSSEEEEPFAVLPVQSTRSRSSSIGSIATVIDKPTARLRRENDDFVYTMAAESPMETVPKIVVCAESSEPETTHLGNQTKPPYTELEKIEKDEEHYHHIRDMYSGFPRKKPQPGKEILGEKELHNAQDRPHQEESALDYKRKRRRPYCSIQIVDAKFSSKNEREKEHKEPDIKKRPLQERRENDKEEKNKNIGYFETIESSDDGGSTDVEVFDLGTL